MPTLPASGHAALHAASDAEEVLAAVACLRARGERVTRPRRAVIEALAGRAEHLTADEVAAAMDTSAVHRATVYRALDLMTEAGVVSARLEAGGPTRYHLATAARGRQHLHGHCRACGRVESLPAGAFDEAADRVRTASGFVLDAGLSAFTGLCADCAPARDH